MEAKDIIVWLVAGITALLGYFSLKLRLKQGNVMLDAVIWILFGLSGACIMFTIFQSSSIKAKLPGGFELGGPIAGLAFIWLTGYRFFKKDTKIEEKRLELDKQEKNLKQREQQLVISDQKGFSTFTGFQTKIFTFPNISDKKIGIAIGNITEVQGIDIWVNSENVFMQMARFFDKSVSGIIRYMGAEKSKDGLIIKDVVAKELYEKTKDLSPVRPCQTFVTSSGNLAATNGVKRIIHVASVEAEPIVGFRPVQDIGRCITNSLKETLDTELLELKPESILFPLIGTGIGRGDKVETVSLILRTALNFLEKNPNSSLKTIYLLAYSNQDLASCERAVELLSGKEVNA